MAMVTEAGSSYSTRGSNNNAGATTSGQRMDATSLLAGRHSRSASPLLTISELAALLGIHRSTLYRTIARSELPLPVIRVGATMRVPRAAVERILGKELQLSQRVNPLSNPNAVTEQILRCHACGSPLSPSSRPKCSAARRSSSSTASV
jgi:excisionase family DNA binding protein